MSLRLGQLYANGAELAFEIIEHCLLFK